MPFGKLGLTFAAVVAASLLASACTTLDAYTRQDKTAHAQRQAIIGAASGAVAGLITGDNSTERKKRALIGAGLGALAGAAVGTYMDRQEAELRKQLDKTGVSVTRNGDSITLNMPGNITFRTDSAGLNADFYPVLNSVAQVLGEFDKTVIQVVGYTDSTGTAAYNQQLSVQRSASVGAYLRTRNISGDRIVEIGQGEQHPVASNDTPEGRQLNRRVELNLVPLTAS
ncbi:MAG TPA: OmpA family protein [Gammaproteobacteria bacterium]|nr:OmpA family protein [Gammaproteobacteria bacterium]